MSIENEAITAPVLRYHGAKFRLAPWIMQFFPKHTCYVEPFGGAAGVLLQKERVYAEVYNDLDGAVVNFFRVLRDPEQRARLIELLVLTPYARADFNEAWEQTDDSLELARRLCIRAQMGFGSAGATKGHTGFRIDTKREYGTAQHLWATYPDSVQAAGKRLTGVLIENRPAIDIILQHDAASTLFFVDPPYMMSTRKTGSNRSSYNHEMDDEMHAELLEVLGGLSGMVVLSGYEHQLYDGMLTGWRRFTTTSRISSARGTALRNEVVWLNPACVAALELEPAQAVLI